jgi:emp24/gp25L/p24 family/GOLD
MSARMTSVARTASAALQLVLVLTIAASRCAALEFDMIYQTKCIMEEINTNVIVVGDFLGYRKDDNSLRVPLDVKVRFYLSLCCLQRRASDPVGIRPGIRMISLGDKARRALSQRVSQRRVLTRSVESASDAIQLEGCWCQAAVGTFKMENCLAATVLVMTLPERMYHPLGCARRQIRSSRPHVSLQVTDPKNKIVYEKKGELDGRFAFTTTEAGDYKACFTARGAMSILLAVARSLHLLCLQLKR